MLTPPQSPKTIWQKLSFYVEILIYLVIIAIAVKIYLPEHQRAKQLEAELLRLEKQRDKTQVVVDQLKREHDNLKNDPKYLSLIHI